MSDVFSDIAQTVKATVDKAVDVSSIKPKNPKLKYRTKFLNPVTHEYESVESATPMTAEKMALVMQAAASKSEQERSHLAGATAGVGTNLVGAGRRLPQFTPNQKTTPAAVKGFNYSNKARDEADYQARNKFGDPNSEGLEGIPLPPSNVFEANAAIRKKTGAQVQKGAQALTSAVGGAAQLGAALATGGASTLASVGLEGVVNALFGPPGEADAAFALLPSVLRGSKMFLVALKSKNITKARQMIQEADALGHFGAKEPRVTFRPQSDTPVKPKAEPVATKPVATPEVDAIEPWQITRSKHLDSVPGAKPFDFDEFDKFRAPYQKRGEALVGSGDLVRTGDSVTGKTAKGKAFLEEWDKAQTAKYGENFSLNREKYRSLIEMKGESGALIKASDVHREAVVKALKEGKPVPPEVLADYPDLAKTAKESKAQGISHAEIDEPGGLSRSSRAIHADLYGTNKPTTIKGKNHGQLYDEGKAKVDEGFDFESEMESLAKAGRPASDEQVGIFAAGRDSLISDLKRLNSRLDNKDASALVERDALLERIAAYDRNLDEVKGAGGRSLAAFKIGNTVKWDDLDEVLIEARRVKPTELTTKDEARFADFVTKQQDADKRISDLESELAKMRAEGNVQTTRTRKLDKNEIQLKRQEIHAEIDAILKEGLGSPANDFASAAYTVAKAGSKLAIAAGKLAANYAQEGIATLDEIIVRVISDFKSRGVEIDRQTIIDEYGKPGTTKTKSDLEKQIANLKREAKSLTTARLNAKDSAANKKYAEMVFDTEEQIVDLKNQLQTGNYRIPQKRELVIEKQIEDLRQERQLYSSKTQSAVRQLDKPGPNLAVKGLKEVSGLGKIATLGADMGALLRQGLHAIPYFIENPKRLAPAFANVRKAMKSEAGLFDLEMASLQKRGPDGRLLEPVRKKHGLSRASVIGGQQEEGYVLGLFDKLYGATLGRIPKFKGAVGSLGRGQQAWLNTIRDGMFDDFAIRHGDATSKELDDWGAFINSAFGRSSVYGTKRTPTELAQIILTSPRYESSRWEMVGNWLASPGTIAKTVMGDKAARAKIINMGATAATVLGTLKITAAATGGELVMDANSPDFLKLRLGDKVIDLTAGVSPRLRGLLRFMFYVKDPEASTQYRKSDGAAYKRNETLPKEILAASTRPVGPAISGGIEELTGYSISGWREEEGDPKGWERLLPLIIQGFNQDREQKGLGEAAGNAAIEFLGGSVQRYKKPPQP